MDIDHIDTEWIDNGCKDIELYNLFYSSEVKNINLYFYYFTEQGLFTVMTSFVYNLSDSILSKNNLITLIKQNNVYNNNKYDLILLLKYNIDLDFSDVINYKHFLIQFYSQCTLNNDIKFNPTINMFNDMNSLYFIFKFSNIKKLKQKSTRKIDIIPRRRTCRILKALKN